MSRTFKDKANHFRFHNKKEDLPLDSPLRDKIEVMEAHGAAYRRGNNRKMKATVKKAMRKSTAKIIRKDLTTPVINHKKIG